MNIFARIANFYDRVTKRKGVPIYQGHERNFPDGRTPDVKEACKRALELGKKSTWVNSWYSHRYANEKGIGSTVRGPFCRWLNISEGGGWDPKKPRPPYVADTGDDADFIAFALNNVESIAHHHLALIDAVDFPNLIIAVDWKIKFETLQKEYAQLHDKYGRSFSAVCDLGDKVHDLKQANADAVITLLDVLNTKSVIHGSDSLGHEAVGKIEALIPTLKAQNAQT